MPKVIKNIELYEMKVAELRNLAKEKGVVGRWNMNKQELIDSICGIEIHKDNKKEKTKNEADEGTFNNGIEIDMEGKRKRLDNLTLGMLVAFRCPNGKVKSAKVEKKSSEMKKLYVQTAYGEDHVIDYDDVLWIRTGSKWPKGVYQLLKGIKEDEKEKIRS